MVWVVTLLDDVGKIQIYNSLVVRNALKSKQRHGSITLYKMNI